MKTLLISSLFAYLCCGAARAQCTNGGLKVQSSTCEPPQNLSVLSMSCSELKLRWIGNPGQAYVVKLHLKDSANGAATLQEQQVLTDKAGNGDATAKLSPGKLVSWSVQAVCSNESYKVYSKEVAGADTSVPFCPAFAATATARQLTAYPNPAKDYLTVVYQPAATGTITYEVFDMNGKKLISRQQTAATGQRNNYQMNISALQPGAYLLKAKRANDAVSEVRFVKAER